MQAYGGLAGQATAEGGWEAEPGWPLGSSQHEALRPPAFSAESLQHLPYFKGVLEVYVEMSFLPNTGVPFPETYYFSWVLKAA